MYEVEIEVTFDAAHRLLNYAGKCHNLHGHTYTAIVCVARNKLVDAGFVIDFGYLKKFVKGWIDGNWDHAAILNPKDELVGVLRGHRMCVFTMDCVDPTAEHMAAALYNAVKNAFPDVVVKTRGTAITGGYPLELVPEKQEVVVRYVSIRETPTSIATYREGDVHGNSTGDCGED